MAEAWPPLAGAPEPRMSAVVRASGSMRGSGGGALHTCSWTPSGSPVGVVVVAHGLAEHSARYDWFATRLALQGYVVHALDHRGHGRSEGRRADIGAFDDIVRDVGALFDRAAESSPSLPHFLLGHSMGGAIAFDWALRHPGRLAGLLLSAPLLALDPATPGWRIALIRLLARVAPGLGAVTLPSDTLSRDPAVVRAYDADPLVFRGAIPARTVAELFTHVGGFAQRAPQLRAPVIVLHGTGDRLVQPVVAALGSTDRTSKLYEGLYHEILNEPEREQVCDDILRWLRGHSTAV
jgi:alpha-beta hydrolase superfamily lysophospholipase